MTPHLTIRGRSLVGTAVAFLAAGTLAGQPALVLTAQLLLAGLAAMYLRSVTRLRALESGELAAALEDAPMDVRVGDAVRIGLRVTNRSRFTFSRVVVDLSVASGVRIAQRAHRIGVLPRMSEVRLEVSGEAVRTGRWMAHGTLVGAEDVFGLVRVATWVRIQRPIRVQPARQPLDRLPLGALTRTLRLPGGAHGVRSRGEGSEILELRDYQPGDSMRRVAWKASARRGRIVVRQPEDERAMDVALLLDMSSTMRGAEGRKFEHALSLVLGLAESLVRLHDRVALVTFDERVYGAVPIGSGREHRVAIVEHLSGLNQVVAGTFTEADDLDVAAELVRYLLVQERLDFRSAPSRETPGEERHPYDLSLLLRWVTERLEVEQGDARDVTSLARHVEHTPGALRRFAQIRGVELGYRVESRPGGREQGLAAALRRVGEVAPRASVVVMVTDLCSVMQLRPVLDAVRERRARGMRVLALVPYSPDYVDGSLVPSEGLEAALSTTFAVAEREARAGYVAELRAAGAEVVVTGPDASLPELLRRIR